MPDSADPAADQVQQAARDPKRVSVDGQTVEAHPIPDQIAAEQRAAANRAARRPHRGLRFTKANPGGTV